jgi:protein SCO1/2
MEKRFIWIASASLAVIALAVVAVILVSRPAEGLHGTVINPPTAAPGFTLTSQSGATVSLEDFRGKYVLLFFGYTNCPDVCPTTTAILKRVRAQLETDAERVQVILVTTDPKRDTPERLAFFVSKFDPAFLGLTGSQADLAKSWKDYGVTVMGNGETHSSRTYLIDPQGRMRAVYPSNLAAELIAADLRRLFQEQ